MEKEVEVRVEIVDSGSRRRIEVKLIEDISSAHTNSNPCLLPYLALMAHVRLSFFN